MRRLLGYLIALVGGLAVLAGIALSILFGPDNEFVSGPHEIQSRGQAIVTAPQAIRYADPDVRIEVRAADPRQRLFIGVANDVDVENYARGDAVTRVGAVHLPWKIATTETTGSRKIAVPPGRLDWWIVSQEGRGASSVTLPLPDAPVDVVVMNADATSRVRVAVSVVVIGSGAFIGGLAISLAGLGIAIAGWVYATNQIVEDTDLSSGPVATAVPRDDRDTP